MPRLRAPRGDSDGCSACSEIAKLKAALGGAAGAYPVLSDGHGGTLIDPIPAAAPKAIDPKVLAFAHAAAAFAPSDAANTALVSSTSPTGQTPFAHATASTGARCCVAMCPAASGSTGR